MKKWRTEKRKRKKRNDPSERSNVEERDARKTKVLLNSSESAKYYLPVTAVLPLRGADTIVWFLYNNTYIRLCVYIHVRFSEKRTCAEKSSFLWEGKVRVPALSRLKINHRVRKSSQSKMVLSSPTANTFLALYINHIVQIFQLLIRSIRNPFFPRFCFVMLYNTIIITQNTFTRIYE